MLAKARAHAKVLAALGFAGADRFTVDNATEIAWANGGRIVALPANPRTARSFTGDTWLDEFAYHADPEGIRDGAFPIATRGDWKVRVFSTPNGARGLFYDWCTSVPAGWALHRVTAQDAINEGLELDPALLLQLTGGDKRLLAQWYGCEFTDADQQYLATELLAAAMRWRGRAPVRSDEGVTFHAGLDIGRKRDLSVLVVVALWDGIAFVVDVLTWPRTKFAEQRAGIEAARAKWEWDSLHVDETGIGSQLAEELVEAFGADEVKPVWFSPLAKEDLATRALRYLARRKLRLPRDERGETLKKEAAAVRRVVNDKGHVSYESPRSAEGHGDRWTALTLALKGAGEPSPIRGVSASPLVVAA